MRLSESVVSVVRTLRRRPADLLPFYVLGAAIPTITRIGTFLGLAIVYVYLETSGRLEAFRNEYATMDQSPPNPEADPEGFVDWMSTELVPVFDPLVTQEVTGVLAIAVLVTALASLVCYAGVAAGQLAACHARLRGKRGLRTGIAGVRRHWRSFLGLFLLELALWIGATVAIWFVTTTASSVVVGATGEPAAGLLPVLGGILLWVATVVVVRALFAFAPVAVVVDDVGVFESLSRTVGFVRSQPVEAVFYYVLAFLTFVSSTAFVSILSVVGVGSVVSLIGLLVLYPALDILKTVLYGDYRGTVTQPPALEQSLRGQFAGGLRRGWDELRAFVRETPALHAGVVATALVGFGMGWAMATPFDGIVETSIAGRLDGHVPHTAAAEFFTNNWTVALTTAYAGVVLAIPALVSIWFNGIVFGIYTRLEADPTELLAFVVPHGILEIPAIFVAGALGVHLGLVGWRTVRGRLSRATLADELERAFWVLVGLGVILLLAAIIEGFVSPYYYRLIF
ncbi:stage II sporulation protein M [Halobacteria archaeon AArc-m2/3/4]|uniref:Stage II sporulation protein M n=1 Tax=Natronoglomus mannanivorans TaxID=2979990 RepID=A0AAP2YZ22_9EURY|nr:stage II sporulation protein M [Halobacteria archaeon AArc-xg1-1]MCU4971296.1 stage II sporulation protein M [Halobacteria archaeon AArc-m2/3/4]